MSLQSNPGQLTRETLRVVAALWLICFIGLVSGALLGRWQLADVKDMVILLIGLLGGSLITGGTERTVNAFTGRRASDQMVNGEHEASRGADRERY